jgi:hypothetical protein
MQIPIYVHINTLTHSLTHPHPHPPTPTPTHTHSNIPNGAVWFYTSSKYVYIYKTYTSSKYVYIYKTYTSSKYVYIYKTYTSSKYVYIDKTYTYTYNIPNGAVRFHRHSFAGRARLQVRAAACSIYPIHLCTQVFMYMKGCLYGSKCVQQNAVSSDTPVQRGGG